MRTRLPTQLLFASLLALSASCGSSDEAAPAAAPVTELRYELLPWTKELTPDTLAAAVVGADDGTVRFKGRPPQLAGLKRGDVLLAGLGPTTPRGLLRVVLDVKDESGDTVVETRPAPIQAAFKSLHARIPGGAVSLDGKPTDPFGVAPKGRYAVGKSVGGGQSIDWRVFDQDGNRATKDDQLYVTGEVTGRVSLTAYVDLDWLDEPAKIAEAVACLAVTPLLCDPPLPDVKLGVRAEAEAAVSVEAEGAASKKFVSDEMPIDGTNVDLPPLVAGPVVVYPSIDFAAQVSGSAAARFRAKAGIKYSASTEASIGLKSGASFVPPTFTRDFDPPTAEASLTADVKAAVGPRIKLMFWDTMGPTVSALGYGRLRANSEASPCFALDVGAELGVTLSLKLPWRLFGGGTEALAKALGLAGDIYKKRFGPYELFSIPNIVSGGCGGLPGGVYPPGDGPSEDAYKNPTFTPWSRRYADDSTKLYQYPYSAESGQIVIHAEQTLDGAWLASGRGVYGAFKIGDGGKLLWAKNVTLAPLDGREYEAERPATYALQARNTHLWVASAKLSLMQLDQDGDLLWAKRFVPKAPPGDAAGDALFALGGELDVVQIVEAPDGGLFVLYSLQQTPNDGPALLLRVDARGDLVWAKKIAFETPKTMIHAMALDGDDVLLAGFSWDPAFAKARVLRVKSDGALAFAKRLDVCGSARVRPVELLRLASGAFALIGGYDVGPERSFLAQMPADASSASVFAWDANSGIVDHRAAAVVQLPITGFVSAAQTAPYVGGPLRLATHDAQGNLTAERELTTTVASTVRDTFPGAIRLTQDGGLLVFAHYEGPSGGSPSLWVSKLPARAMEADFGGTDVAVSTPTSIPRPACTAALAADGSVAYEDVALEGVDAAGKVTVTAVAPKEQALLPR